MILLSSYLECWVSPHLWITVYYDKQRPSKVYHILLVFFFSFVVLNPCPLSYKQTCYRSQAGVGLFETSINAVYYNEMESGLEHLLRPCWQVTEMDKHGSL